MSGRKRQHYLAFCQAAIVLLGYSIADSVKVIETKDCMIKVPNGKQVVIQGLDGCIVAEHDNTLLICMISEEQRIKEWHE